MNESDIVNTVTSVWDRILAAPLHLLIVLLLNVLGWLLKKYTPLPNRWIPLTLIGLSTALYPLLINPGTVSPTVRFPLVVVIIHGFLLGALAWVVHRFVLKKFGSWLSENLGDPDAPTPPNVGLWIGAALLGAVMVTGCATSNSTTPPGTGTGDGGPVVTNGAPTFTPEQAKRAATLITRITTRFAVVLTKDVNLRQDFELAAVGLDGLLLQGQMDSQSVRETLAQRLNIAPDDEVWLLVESLLDVWQIYLDPLLQDQLAKNDYVKPILEGLRDGLRASVAKAALRSALLKQLPSRDHELLLSLWAASDRMEGNLLR